MVAVVISVRFFWSFSQTQTCHIKHGSYHPAQSCVNNNMPPVIWGFLYQARTRPGTCASSKHKQSVDFEASLQLKTRDSIICRQSPFLPLASEDRLLFPLLACRGSCSVTVQPIGLSPRHTRIYASVVLQPARLLLLSKAARDGLDPNTTVLDEYVNPFLRHERREKGWKN